MVRSLLQKVLLALGTTLCVPTSAADCPEPPAFQAQVLKVVGRDFPGHVVRFGPDDAVQVDAFVFGLENLRKRVCAADQGSPADRELIIQEHFRGALRFAADARSGKKLDWPVVRDHVVVQLVKEDLAARIHLVRRPLVQGVAVVVVFDLPTAYGYVSEAQFRRWGVGRDEVFEQAINNLATRTRGQMGSAGEGGDRVLIVGERDGYDAARILMPHLRKAAAGLLGDPFRAAIPNRDFLVMWASGNAKFSKDAGSNARRDFQAQPYPISPLVLEVWGDGRIAAVRGVNAK